MAEVFCGWIAVSQHEYLAGLPAGEGANQGVIKHRKLRSRRSISLCRNKLQIGGPAKNPQALNACAGPARRRDSMALKRSLQLEFRRRLTFAQFQIRRGRLPEARNHSEA